ncbi:MAG: hypothetical protein KBC15_03410 [Candidatus Levybacteria bacterium]|nr:hypothetical protein [Candidatus Levybacteria bacterium]
MPDLFVAKPTRKVVEEKPVITEATKPGVITIQKRELHPFSSFHKFPEGVVFENQEKDEVIHLFLRRHLITNIGWVVSSISLALLPLLVFLIHASGIFLFPEIPFSYLLISVLFYYIILFGYNLVNTVSWFYNIGLVTQLRVVDVDLSNIQHKNVSATTLEDIVDVSYSQKGFFQSLFDYGDVVIQTEGIRENFEFLKVPHPAKVADVVSDLVAGRSNV